MKVFNVSYDLNKFGKDYNGLHEELKKSSNWWHYLDSTWLIATNESASGIFTRLRSHIDNDDFILIIQVTSDFSGWLPEKAWDWIKRYLS